MGTFMKLYSFGSYEFDVETHEVIRENDKCYVIKDNYMANGRTIRKSDMENSGRIYATSMDELDAKKRDYIAHLIAYHKEQIVKHEESIKKVDELQK